MITIFKDIFGGLVTACLISGMLFFTGCKTVNKSKSIDKAERKETSETTSDLAAAAAASTTTETTSKTISTEEADITLKIEGEAVISPDGTITTSADTKTTSTTKKKKTVDREENHQAKDTTSTTINASLVTVSEVEENKQAKTGDVERKPPYGLYIVLVLVAIGLLYIAYRYFFKGKWHI